ncbi:hypothetical protein M5D96_002263 [Drosophila gunungcola]|uniref:Uncharacterized protein n=1 Tax=Drosophila gunungcola TaxID=103775 RepID=A0A9P9Z059_9MUSC|nr:hypothetical protein M5D96_002263 [Drosophila gunungcola]
MPLLQAIADILVIVFCLPATLIGNIFVRKYLFNSVRRRDLFATGGRIREQPQFLCRFCILAGFMCCN